MLFASASCAMTRSRAARPKASGNPVFYVGPATGRDGLAGAAFASQDLTEESADQQRGAVQVGDPFMEKLVLRSVPGIAGHRCRGRHSGHGRGGLDLFDLRNRGARRHRHRNRIEQSAATRAEHDALRNHVERIAGADAHHRPERAAKMKSNAFLTSGTCLGRRSAASPTPAEWW